VAVLGKDRAEHPTPAVVPDALARASRIQATGWPRRPPQLRPDLRSVGLDVRPGKEDPPLRPTPAIRGEGPGAPRVSDAGRHPLKPPSLR
jgi:hypothetical protein